jgi:hypothetical protein
MGYLRMSSQHEWTLVLVPFLYAERLSLLSVRLDGRPVDL